ncbi:hypothetical protein HDV01_002255 [Terramyces sp. JEL0728]|nr:hypothetical protein HDV01_002255 [Terramyces sp. JEL0728]
MSETESTESSHSDLSGDETPKRLSQVKRPLVQLERKPLIQLDNPPADTITKENIKDESVINAPTQPAKKDLKQDALLALQGLQAPVEQPIPMIKEPKKVKSGTPTTKELPNEPQAFRSPDFQELDSLFKTLNGKFYYCGFVYKLNLLGASGKTLFADNLTGQAADKNAFWSKWWMELWGPILNLWKVPDELASFSYTASLPIQQSLKNELDPPFELMAAIKQQQNVPVCINISSCVTEIFHSSVSVAFPTAPSPPIPYTCNFALSNAGSNLYLFSSASVVQSNHWIAAIRLAMYELQKLNSLFTYKLLRRPTMVGVWREFGVEPFKSQVFRGEIRHEGALQLRLPYSNTWKQYHVVVTSKIGPEAYETQGGIKLFGKKKHMPTDLSKRGSLLFYDKASSAKKGKPPVFQIEDIRSICTIWPEKANEAITESVSMAKIEGIFELPSTVDQVTHARSRTFTTNFGRGYPEITGVEKLNEYISGLDNRPPQDVLVLTPSTHELSKWITAILSAFGIDSQGPAIEEELLEISKVPEKNRSRKDVPWPTQLFLSLGEVGGITMPVCSVIETHTTFAHYLRQKITFSKDKKLLNWCEAIAKGEWERSVNDRKEMDFKFLQLYVWAEQICQGIQAYNIPVGKPHPTVLVGAMSSFIPWIGPVLTSMLGDIYNQPEPQPEPENVPESEHEPSEMESSQDGNGSESEVERSSEGSQSEDEEVLVQEIDGVNPNVDLQAFKENQALLEVERKKDDFAVYGKNSLLARMAEKEQVKRPAGPLFGNILPPSKEVEKKERHTSLNFDDQKAPAQFGENSLLDRQQRTSQVRNVASGPLFNVSNTKEADVIGQNSLLGQQQTGASLQLGGNFLDGNKQDSVIQENSLLAQVLGPLSKNPTTGPLLDNLNLNDPNAPINQSSLLGQDKSNRNTVSGAGPFLNNVAPAKPDALIAENSLLGQNQGFNQRTSAYGPLVGALPQAKNEIAQNSLLSVQQGRAQKGVSSGPLFDSVNNTKTDSIPQNTLLAQAQVMQSKYTGGPLIGGLPKTGTNIAENSLLAQSNPLSAKIPASGPLFDIGNNAKASNITQNSLLARPAQNSKLPLGGGPFVTAGAKTSNIQNNSLLAQNTIPTNRPTQSGPFISGVSNAKQDVNLMLSAKGRQIEPERVEELFNENSLVQRINQGVGKKEFLAGPLLGTVHDPHDKMHHEIGLLGQVDRRQREKELKKHAGGALIGIQNMQISSANMQDHTIVQKKPDLHAGLMAEMSRIKQEKEMYKKKNTAGEILVDYNFTDEKPKLHDGLFAEMDRRQQEREMFRKHGANPTGQLLTGLGPAPGMVPGGGMVPGFVGYIQPPPTQTQTDITVFAGKVAPILDQMTQLLQGSARQPNPMLIQTMLNYISQMSTLVDQLHHPVQNLAVPTNTYENRRSVSPGANANPFSLPNINWKTGGSSTASSAYLSSSESDAQSSEARSKATSGTESNQDDGDDHSGTEETRSSLGSVSESGSEESDDEQPRFPKPKSVSTDYTSNTGSESATDTSLTTSSSKEETDSNGSVSDDSADEPLGLKDHRAPTPAFESINPISRPYLGVMPTQPVYPQKNVKPGNRSSKKKQAKQTDSDEGSVSEESEDGEGSVSEESEGSISDDESETGDESEESEEDRSKTAARPVDSDVGSVSESGTEEGSQSEVSK